MIFLLCAVWCASTGSPTPTVEPMTLERALQLALGENPALKARAHEVARADDLIYEAGRRPNPVLETELEQFAGSGVARGVDNAELTLSLSQTIETAGKRVKRVGLAGLDKELAGLDREITVRQVAVSVHKAFYILLAAQENVRLAKQLHTIAGAFEETVAARVKAGKVAPLEQNKAHVDLSRAALALRAAERDLATARRRLEAAWGGHGPKVEAVSGDLYTITMLQDPGLADETLSANPERRRALLATDRERAMLALTQAEATPDIDLMAGITRFEESSDTGFRVGFSLDLPFFNRKRGAVRAAGRAVSARQMEAAALTIDLQTALFEEHQGLTAAYDQALILRDEAVPAAERVYEVAHEGYTLGKFGYLDVLDAQRTLFETKRGYVEALATYHERRINQAALQGGLMGMDTRIKGDDDE